MSLRLLRPALRAHARAVVPIARAPVARASFAAPRFSMRAYSTGPGKEVKESDSVRASNRAANDAAVGPFTWKAAAVFVVVGVGLYFYFTNEKEKVLERRRKELETKSVGRPSIGGPFVLTDHNGKDFTEKDLLGKWTLIYFGFTHCPDICPEELDKMAAVVDTIDKEKGPVTLPVFVSVDPARDSVEQVANYVVEFHPRLVGLTGDYDSVKRACKSYRVYFSTPPDAKATDDYLVDHSIFFYLMDPLGQFVDAFGKNTTAEEVVVKVREAMGKWEAAGGNKAAGV